MPSGRGPRYILYGAGSKNGWVQPPTIFKHKDGHKDFHTGMNSDHFEVSAFRKYDYLVGGCNNSIV